MASPPIPPSLDHLATRPFSFYPPILNIEHNEWLFRKATWSEILVVHCKSGTEIWIPRRFVGEVSRVDDPVLIVGLLRELEYKGGTVMPFQRRVIEMPMAVGGPAPKIAHSESEHNVPAPIVGIRLESTDKRILKMIGAAVVVALVLYGLAMNFTRIGNLRQKTTVYTFKDQAFLELSGRDDFLTIKQKLGEPSSDRWSETGGIQFRALGYPERRYTVILMGSDRNSTHYIGALNDQWQPIHSVELHSGGTTSSLLRNLKQF